MKKLLILSLFIPLISKAQLPKPSESIAKVYSEFSSCAFIDTTYADKTDPEGKPIVECLIFAPVYYEGIRGFDVVTFDAAGLASAAKWHHKAVELDGDNADFYVSYLNPNRPMLDSLRSDGTITQLTSIVENIPKSWGKPDKAATESKIAYYFKGHHIVHGVELEEGALTVGWVLN